jgi:hypothetical protein
MFPLISLIRGQLKIDDGLNSSNRDYGLRQLDNEFRVKPEGPIRSLGLRLDKLGYGTNSSIN